MVEYESNSDRRANIAEQRIPILCDQLLGIRKGEYSFRRSLELLYGEVRALCRGNGGFCRSWWNCRKTSSEFDSLGWRLLVTCIRDYDEFGLTRADLRNIMVVLRGFLASEELAMSAS